MMENIQLLYEIRRIYNEYLSEAERLKADLKPTDGLLGFGTKAGLDPCHDRFSERLEQAVTSISAGSPSSEAALAVLRYMYDAPLAHKNNGLVYWMLMAVHTLTEKLIGFLTPEDAAGLALWYTDTYPRSERLPAQNRIAAQLQAQAGFVRAKRSLLGRLRGKDKDR
jgi:hypothetical protein